MPNSTFGHIEPGSVRRITPSELKNAWENRNVAREESLSVFRDAMLSYRRYEIEEILDATGEEINKFIAPRLPADVAARVVPLIPTGHPSSAEWRSTGDREALDRAIGELRYVGWYQSEIAEGLGVSRQSVVKANPSGAVIPLDPDEWPEPERLRFVSLRMVPAYIFAGEEPPTPSKRDVPSDVRDRMFALDDAVQDATRRAILSDGGSGKSKDSWELVRRAELALVTYTRRVSADSRVSLISLSEIIRPNNRHYLARMARRHGIAEYVPPSVEKVSPVRKTWEKSRAGSASAIDRRPPRAQG